MYIFVPQDRYALNYAAFEDFVFNNKRRWFLFSYNYAWAFSYSSFEFSSYWSCIVTKIDFIPKLRPKQFQFSNAWTTSLVAYANIVALSGIVCKQKIFVV